ncbi:PepSY-like domain-containing protein [Algoriphagus vanfongensis]|uniref:PepSY-like domain-containing protein n=1 Tax=Algoriphagus vanfongensis TaxID=426371 RepID=UPI0003F8ECD7|nr:PepSY-like domain-containing protein [Algoriphagus vanfongensis]
MKKQILLVATLTIVGLTQAQDLLTQQVPSVILNQFQTEYPKASDIDWEIKGDLYQVEFETGWNVDHEIWYNAEGKILKHKEDISEDDLPKAVKDKIKADFKGYSLDDLERITDKGTIVYKLELNALTKQDFDLVIDAKGMILSKKAD